MEGAWCWGDEDLAIYSKETVPCSDEKRSGW